MNVDAARQIPPDFSASLGAGIIRLHLKAARLAYSPIEYVAGKCLHPLASLFQRARRFTIIDYPYTRVLRIIDLAAVRLLNRPAFPPVALKTLKQIEREREVRRYIGEMDEGSAQLCHFLARYIHEVIPLICGEKLTGLAPLTEQWTLYCLGFKARWLNRQMCMKTGYRNSFLKSKIQKAAARVLGGACAKTAGILLHEDNLLPLLDFEHLFLKLCSGIKRRPAATAEPRWISAAVGSLGASLSRQREIEAFIGEHRLGSEKEKMIARLAWHQRNGTLPRGVPDPRDLTPENLDSECDRAMYAYLNEVVEEYLDKLPIGNRGLSGVLYYLEGKAFLKELFTTLIIEQGMKQLIEPNAFALAVLLASGEETADLEPDGFGRGTRPLIIDTGQAMMRGMAQKDFAGTSIASIFESSGLRARRGGMEAIQQKQDVKRMLRDYISKQVYGMIKDQKSYMHQPGMLTYIRKEVSKLPVVGGAAMSMHFLISGAFFSVGYLFRDKSQKKDSLLKYLFKHISGKDLAKTIADWIVDLIYHPSWRITLLRLVETLVEHDRGDIPPRQVSKEDFEQVTSFLLRRFLKASSIPIRSRVEPIVTYLTGEEAFLAFKKFLRPQKTSFLESALPALLPSIKELVLYNRTTSAFRKANILFNGDAKFWEVYIREWLNRLVSMEMGSIQQHFRKEPPAVIRERFIDKLLTISPFDFGEFFYSSVQAKEEEEPSRGPVTEQFGNSQVTLFQDYRPDGA